MRPTAYRSPMRISRSNGPFDTDCSSPSPSPSPAAAWATAGSVGHAPAQQEERDGEAGRVERVDEPRPRRDREHPAERRPQQHARVDGQRQDRGRRRELRARHDARRRRLERGPLQRRERHHQRRHHVQRPQQRVREQRVEQQQNAAQGQPRLAPAHQRPPVEPVREHPAVEPEHDQRHQLGQPQRADDQRRSGQLLGLHQQRDLGRLRPQVHHGPAEEDRAERPRPRPAQRRRIRPQRRPAHGPSTSITRGRYQPSRPASESFSAASRAGTRDRAAIQPRVVGQIHPAVVNATACNSPQRAVVDRLMMRDAVTQQVQIAHRIMNVPAHPPSPDSREGVAQTGQPQRALVAAGEQEPPEPERELGHDPAGALRPSARRRRAAARPRCRSRSAR